MHQSIDHPLHLIDRNPARRRLAEPTVEQPLEPLLLVTPLSSPQDASTRSAPAHRETSPSCVPVAMSSDRTDHVLATDTLGSLLGKDSSSPDFSNPLMHRGGESRKMAIRQSLTAIPERPRCKQSVAQHCSNLNRLNGTRLWPGSMAESSHRMPEGCCWGGWIAASG